ncbi:uncharacterized protein LOC112144116 isoform X2 [Oryzias melastigma]|uniref:uncharacterized protein LOC112144116 isoform X2 n=1 Tax=Oryzias melastigma TaxID=30732 RepID=UPI000CF7BFE1|nr:uncharacterized protein LOC112144116 isoform X2 [Oryzias melastigma]
MFPVKLLTLILVVTAQYGTVTCSKTTQSKKQTTGNVTDLLGSKAQNGTAICFNTTQLKNLTMSNITAQNGTVICPTTTATITQSKSHPTGNVTASTTVNSSVNNSSEDLFKNVMESIQELPGMILFGTGFLMGIILTAVITCITNACQRGKKRRSSYRLGDVEMNTQASTKADGDAVQDGAAADGEVGSAGQLLLNGDGAPKEAEYSDLDFSAAKNRKVAEVRTIPETEYAEIKIENQAENAEVDGEILESNHETLREDENGEEMFCVPPQEIASEDFSGEFSGQITDET